MKKLKLLLPTILGISIIFSCSREEKGVNNHTSNNYYERIGLENPTYSNNYLDSVGVIHNEILASVIQNKHHLVTQDDYISYSKNVFETDYDFTHYASYVLSNSDIKNILKDSDNSYYYTIENTELSKEAKQYIGNLVSLLETLSKENEDELGYSFVKDNIISFENQVLYNYNLDTNEKNIILAVTSVARYSSFFWYNEYQSYLNSIRDGVIPVPPYEVEKKWWKWLVVAVSDVAGAVAGGVAGSTAGPVGTTAGAIAGSAGASSGAASLVDWVQQ